MENYTDKNRNQRVDKLCNKCKNAVQTVCKAIDPLNLYTNIKIQSKRQKMHLLYFKY